VEETLGGEPVKLKVGDIVGWKICQVWTVRSQPMSKSKGVGAEQRSTERGNTRKKIKWVMRNGNFGNGGTDVKKKSRE